MKNLSITLIFTLLFLSCIDEYKVVPCDCGTVINKGILVEPISNDNWYWLEVQNICTNNKKLFGVEESVWIKTYIGEDFCIDKEPFRW